ncbi:hypothetical protein Lal_00015054 [Lupinus albus]|nr:hypothetical protein Lal_00015054 [Lupinus albus]
MQAFLHPGRARGREARRRARIDDHLARHAVSAERADGARRRTGDPRRGRRPGHHRPHRRPHLRGLGRRPARTAGQRAGCAESEPARPRVRAGREKAGRDDGGRHDDLRGARRHRGVRHGRHRRRAPGRGDELRHFRRPAGTGAHERGRRMRGGEIHPRHRSHAGIPGNARRARGERRPARLPRVLHARIRLRCGLPARHAAAAGPLHPHQVAAGADGRRRRQQSGAGGIRDAERGNRRHHRAGAARGGRARREGQGRHAVPAGPHQRPDGRPQPRHQHRAREEQCPRGRPPRATEVLPRGGRRKELQPRRRAPAHLAAAAVAADHEAGERTGRAPVRAHDAQLRADGGRQGADARSGRPAGPHAHDHRHHPPDRPRRSGPAARGHRRLGDVGSDPRPAGTVPEPVPARDVDHPRTGSERPVGSAARQADRRGLLARAAHRRGHAEERGPAPGTVLPRRRVRGDQRPASARAAGGHRPDRHRERTNAHLAPGPVGRAALPDPVLRQRGLPADDLPGSGRAPNAACHGRCGPGRGLDAGDDEPHRLARRALPARAHESAVGQFVHHDDAPVVRAFLKILNPAGA